MKRTELEKLIAKLEPAIRKVFLQQIAQIKDKLSLKEIERLLSLGQVDEALRAITSGVDNLANAVINFTVVSGVQTAAAISDSLGIVVTFDQTNFRAVEMMRENKLRLVREFTAEQIEATREALITGIGTGANPKAQARAFRDSIGLTRRQQQAVNNYRRLLEEGNKEALTRQLRDKRFDRTVENAFTNNRSLTKAEIDRMVQRYQERYLKYRSQTIARTEALRSAHQGNEEMFNQAIEAGSLDTDGIERTWITARDERVRSSHSAMLGQKRKMGESFISGNGYALRYPGDPNAPGSETINCRCIATTRIKEI